MGATIVWFRQDLRLHDNPALTAALKSGGAVIPVYIFDEQGEGDWRIGGASKWWLHHSLSRLDESLRERGSRLILAKGRSADVLAAVIKNNGVTSVFWNRRYEPAVIERDKQLKTSLLASGIETKSFDAALLFEPHTVKNKSGGPFQVFTPYWRHCLALPVEEPVKLPTGEFSAPAKWPASIELSQLSLLPKIKWDTGIAAAWEPGEAAGMKRLKKFVADGLEDYDDARNFPNKDGTSSMSPYLHFGEIGPRQIWAAVRALSKSSGVFPAHLGGQVYLKEIGWREFAHHLLYHFPQTPAEPLREDFKKFPWLKNAKQLRAWQRGLTGYPIVDAGMRQLWTTGWMHNRVRMIVASFLVKHLRMSWQDGAAWFWDTLVDADLANNTLGWQWSAGCGADAAPYFRIFNPTLQGAKFDLEGDYVRAWVPELKDLPSKFIHEPWNAPAETLARAGVLLGKTYPTPVVEHGQARDAALAALKTIRRAGPV
ncbi:cryptochrome/photolyase family protein [Oleiharenicola lentus]|uniref:cryptochrome/photolyase family protein n=1 Tax=Oleiharenicola lentus TaxID=2508720 RepID=UPI003F66C19F